MVHVDVPAGAYWNVTCCTPVSESLAEAPSETLPRTGLPGSVSVEDGAVVSTSTVVETETVLPTLSVPVSVKR